MIFAVEVSIAALIALLAAALGIGALFRAWFSAPFPKGDAPPIDIGDVRQQAFARECDRMRQASGQVEDDRPLVSFLYYLGRDYLTLSQLEKVIDEATIHQGGKTARFTNGWLARWAQDAADKIQGVEPAPGTAHPSRSEESP